MEPGETTEAPNMGMRVTCRESAASSGGELLSFDFWMRGGATPPPMHVHPHQEERVTVVTRQMADGHVLYTLLIAPGRDYNTVSAAFNRMVQSLRVNDDAAHASNR